VAADGLVRRGQGIALPMVELCECVVQSARLCDKTTAGMVGDEPAHELRQACGSQMLCPIQRVKAGLLETWRVADVVEPGGPPPGTVLHRPERR